MVSAGMIKRIIFNLLLRFIICITRVMVKTKVFLQYMLLLIY